MRGKANLVKGLLCVLFLTWPVQAKYGGGSGEPNDPYLIYTAEQMNAIGTEPNDWDKDFKLMADIDLRRYAEKDFNIIGTGYLPAFTGVFDGNGHTISNFTYTSTDLPCVGIFGYIDGPDARISNLGLIDPNVDAGTGIGVGSLAGWIEMGAITNCYVVDGSVSGKGYVGGLVGKNAGSITDCYATGSVTGISFVGGLVGGNRGLGRISGWRSTGNIDRCYATGNVTGYGAVGGLVGANHYATVMNCFSTTDVIGEGSVGGLVGTNSGNIVTCYSHCIVDAEDKVGGLVGENNGDVGNCYSYCTVDAEDMVGGLVGRNEGIVMASCSSASVQGREEVGGLVGRNSYHGEIVDCYAKGDVVGQWDVGGLVGNNHLVVGRGGGEQYYGTVRTCYSATAVSGDEQIGGLVGYNQSGGVHDSFWDIEISGQTTSAGGVGKTTAQMQTAGTFLDADWDFVDETENGTEDIWIEPDGGGYPILWWQLSPLPELPTFSGGTGEPDDPYLISTVDELNSIGHKPRLMVAHFKLINDIDLAGVNFSIIGSRWYPFCGMFDGNGHTISNFSYTSADATYIGLFRYAVGAEIKDLRLIGPNVHVDRGDFHGSLVGHLDGGTITNCYVEAGSVSGNDYVGGLVGSSSGVIANCYATGNVAGYGDYVGGLVGRNKFTVKDCYAICSVDGAGDDVGGLVGRNGGTIVASYSHASVKGRNAVGGLVGRCSPGETINCYARGDVVGQWYVGGLVGTNGLRSGRHIGTIRDCYSATTILGGNQNGGLLGSDWGGEVRGSFWDIETSGRTTSYGGTGKTTAEMQMAGTFLDAGWDFINETENGTEDVWYILEGQDYPRLWWELIGDNSPAFAEN